MPKNVITYNQFIKGKVNEGKHGKIEIWGQNDGEEPMIIGYAGTEEIALDIEEDFKDDFETIWHQE